MDGLEDWSERAYDAAVAELFARRPQRMVPDLDRMRALLRLLGDPEQAYPAIQVTGTNGKTTTTTMIACLLGALGLAAGNYTSPQLQDVRERIRIVQEPIAQELVTQRMLEVAPFVREVDAQSKERVTFFELLTALAIVHFADVPVDVAAVEVGMGGVWDATNVVRGEVAVLTTVSLDHRELGVSTKEVAEEKSGIIKDGAMVVSAPQDEQAAAVIRRVTDQRGAHLVVAGSDFAVADRQLAVGGQQISLKGVTGTFDHIFLPLHGAHQAMNAACALAAVEAFLGFAGGINPQIVREGFAAVRAPGRLEVVAGGEEAATIVLDGAHNPSGAQALAAAMRSEFHFRQRVMVLGVLDDKDVEGICSALADTADHVIVTEAPSVRTTDPERLFKAVQQTGVSVERAEDVRSALAAAAGMTGPADGVLVTGSLTVVGAARDALGLPVA